MDSDNTAFVVGVFRSGTSLLTLILNQNPEVALMYECDLWNFPQLLMPFRFRHDWLERIEFYNQSLSRHGLLACAREAGGGGIHAPQDMYRAYGGIKQARIHGEKSPFFCNRLERLHELHPGAAFIFVWRSPFEVYRSVLKAGQTSRFFGRPGMLSRMIYLQETALRQLRRIRGRGARICHVDYAAVVDDTERVCRELCQFLRVEYHPRMLKLDQADRSAIFKSPHHESLHRGVIQRQTYERELVPVRLRARLQRFERRWEGMQAGWMPSGRNDPGPGAGRFELGWHLAAGWLLTGGDSLIRAGFEFMPLVWLRVYRLLKNWLVNPPSGQADEKTSMFKDFQRHWLTLLTALLLLGGVVYAHLHVNPHLMFVLFYGLPAALVALVVNARWASVFVLAACVISPMIQYDGDPDYRPALVFAWNFFSRLVILETFVLVLSRIRLELSGVSDHAK